MKSLDDMTQGEAAEYLKEAVAWGDMTIEKATALLYAKAKGGLTWIGAKTTIHNDGPEFTEKKERRLPECQDEQPAWQEARDKTEALREKLFRDRNRT